MEKTRENLEYKQLKADLAQGMLKNLYIFHGEERYLLEYYLGQMRKTLLVPGMEEFNHKRFDGKKLSLNDLAEAVDALPVFAERTLIEVSDYDVFQGSEAARNQLLQLCQDIPPYATLVFLYDTVPFKVDGRSKGNAALKKCFSIVEFTRQKQSDLLNWIARRFKAHGKKLDKPTAEYFSFVTGGLMTGMIPEIEKVSAYAKGETIAREDIDAVVVPVLDAATYKMTDALLKRDYNEAARLLAELLFLQEQPHRILYSISQKMRQLLAAQICGERGLGINNLMDICGIRYEFQAKHLLAAGRRQSSAWCKEAVRTCSQAALAMNQGSGDNGALLSQVLIELAEAQA